MILVRVAIVNDNESQIVVGAVDAKAPSPCLATIGS
jgi:hypothetical protein